MVRKGEYSWECPYCTRIHDDPYLIGVGKLMDDAIRRVDKMKETVETFELRMSSDFVPGDTVDLKVVPKKGDLQGSVSLLTEDAEWDASTAEWMNARYNPGYDPDMMQMSNNKDHVWLGAGLLITLAGLFVPGTYGLLLLIPGLMMLIPSVINVIVEKRRNKECIHHWEPTDTQGYSYECIKCEEVMGIMEDE